MNLTQFGQMAMTITMTTNVFSEKYIETFNKLINYNLKLIMYKAEETAWL